jgi:hypothetical protein
MMDTYTYPFATLIAPTSTVVMAVVVRRWAK